MAEYKIIRCQAQYPALVDTWIVTTGGFEGFETLSHHDSEVEARVAVKRYQAADNRRVKS